MTTYIVSTIDLVNARNAGRFGGSYVSPPQPRGQALRLVRSLLGEDVDPTRNAWSTGIPHGRRIVTIDTASGGHARRAAASR
ncbi:MAG TPA: hypothetical protein VGM91_19215 [Conexibacter sp.]|jgi:hypothetical protein